MKLAGLIFSKKFSDYIVSDEYNGQFKKIYLDFCRESQNELFNTPEEATEFYSKDENYKSLLKGEVGENFSKVHCAITFIL